MYFDLFKISRVIAVYFKDHSEVSACSQLPTCFQVCQLSHTQDMWSKTLSKTGDSTTSRDYFQEFFSKYPSCCLWAGAEDAHLNLSWVDNFPPCCRNRGESLQRLPQNSPSLGTTRSSALPCWAQPCREPGDGKMCLEPRQNEPSHPRPTQQIFPERPWSPWALPGSVSCGHCLL